MSGSLMPGSDFRELSISNQKRNYVQNERTFDLYYRNFRID
jgi:hypothetical protein